MLDPIPALLDTLDISRWYTAAPWAIDSLIYLVIFTGLTRATLAKRFEGRAGMAVAIGMGVALTVAAAMTARRTGFALADLGPVAWLVLLLVLGAFLYDLLRRVGAARVPAVAVALLVLGGLGATLGDLLDGLLIAAGITGGLAAVAGLGLVLLIGWGVTRFGGHGKGDHSEDYAGHRGWKGPQDSEHIDDGLPRLVGVEARRLDESVAELLERLRRCVHGDGDRHDEIGPLLSRIDNTSRRIERLYAEALRSLAKRRLREGGLPKSMLEAIQEVMLAARENTMRFGDTLQVAIAAHDAGNQRLLREAVDRMLHLERQALRLNEQLEALLRRSAPHAR